MSRPRTMRQRLSRTLAFRLPGLGDFGARALTGTLPLLDRVGATSSWLRVLYAIFGYWYERGLADTVGTEDALTALLEGAGTDRPAEAEPVEIDLAGGLKSALHEADRIRPHAVTLCVGPRPVAHLPWEPGAEPLAGRHIAAALVQRYHRPVFELLRAMGHVRLEAPAPVAGPDPHGTAGHDGGRDFTMTGSPPREGSLRMR
jgi:hypothetical protein